MKLLHLADLHLGQQLYQSYQRADEHRHAFNQVRQWCHDLQPDALVVSGDVFDVAQPSAATLTEFSQAFVALHEAAPSMRMVIMAGNHDSPSRLQAQSAVWQLANVHLVGLAPAMHYDQPRWQEDYIDRLPGTGYIIAFPYTPGDRRDTIQQLLDYVARENTQGLPVVLMAHTAVTGADVQGHNFDIGTLRALPTQAMGQGYDYLALGHLHKPQTLDHPEDAFTEEVTYPSPVARYSGSMLHVSCDEQYPHTASMVTITTHQGEVTIRQLRIQQLRHFYELPAPTQPAADSWDEAREAIQRFVNEGGRGYIRLRMARQARLAADYQQRIYDMLQPFDDEVRYNPKILWEGADAEVLVSDKKPEIPVAVIQEMAGNPLEFVKHTIEQYPEFTLEQLCDDFEAIDQEVRRLNELSTSKAAKK